MLQGKEVSPVGLFAFNAPNMTNPYSVKDHVEQLPENSQYAVKSIVAANLSHMLYLKRLESILDLYDCYDVEDEKKLLNGLPRGYDYIPTTATIVAAGVSALYLRRKFNLPLFQFETYVDKLYSLLFVFGFSYFGFKIFCGRSYEKYFKSADCAILSTKSKLHTDCVKINNTLRFKRSDTI
jgi:hypothetical protein